MARKILAADTTPFGVALFASSNIAFASMFLAILIGCGAARADIILKCTGVTYVNSAKVATKEEYFKINSLGMFQWNDSTSSYFNACPDGFVCNINARAISYTGIAHGLLWSLSISRVTGNFDEEIISEVGSTVTKGQCVASSDPEAELTPKKF